MNLTVAELKPPDWWPIGTLAAFVVGGIIAAPITRHGTIKAARIAAKAAEAALLKGSQAAGIGQTTQSSTTVSPSVNALQDSYHRSMLVKSDPSSISTLVQHLDFFHDIVAVDMCLYTAETVVTNLRQALESHDSPLTVRLLVRRPETDPGKHDVAEASLRTISEIAGVNSRVRFDVHFYNDDPLLRVQNFVSRSRSVCLLGIYRFEESHSMRFVGAENNHMLVLDSQKPPESDVIGAVTSRFGKLWNETSALRAVLFDLDGVLIDSMEEHCLSWSTSFKNCGLFPVGREQEFRRVVYELEGRSAYETVEMLCDRFGVHAPENVIRSVIEGKETLFFMRLENIKAVEGMAAILTDLEGRGVPTAVVSGSSRRAVTAVLGRLYDHKFDAIVCGDDDSEPGKPSPAPFSKAIEKLRIRDPRGAVAVENSPLGVQSAVAAGLQVLGLLRESPLPSSVLKDAGASSVYVQTDDMRTVLTEAHFPSPSRR